MRRTLWISAALAAVMLPAAGLSAQEQQNQSQQSQSQTQSQSQSQSQPQSATEKNRQQPSTTQSQASQGAKAASTQQDSLADAARKAREQKKDSAKPAKVFTNDDLPGAGGISTVGDEKQPPGAGVDAADATAQGPGAANDEKTWRARFAKLRHKLDQDQDELDVLQREVGVAQVQYYGGDPNKAVGDQSGQQPFGTEYTKKVAEIDAKKKQIEADKQAIADAEDELRRAGGDPGWAR